MDLSTTEAGLLYSIKTEPGKTITYYGDQLRMTSNFLSRPLEKLMRLGYVVRDNNKLTISEAFLKKEEQKAEAVVEIPEPVVEKTKTTFDVVAEPKTVETIVGLDPVPLSQVNSERKSVVQEMLDDAQGKPRVTSMELQKLLADGVPRTALAIAVHFGFSRGTAVAQVLRNMCTANVMVKEGPLYSLKHEPTNEVRRATEATEASVVPEKVEKPELDECELRAAIEQIHQPFTAHECHLILQRDYTLDHSQFFDVFETLAFSGLFLAWDGSEFVDPVTDYSPAHKFIVRARVDANVGIAAMDAYCKTYKEPYKLFDVVSSTRLHPSEVLSYFDDMSYFIGDKNSITHGNFAPHYPNRRDRQQLKKGPAPAKPYVRLETLEQKNVMRFMLGGVAVDTFIKRFHLDPAEKARIVELLVTADIARHDTENDWIFLRDGVEIAPLKLGDAEGPEPEAGAEALAAQEFPSLENLQLKAPTGHPPHAWSEQEKAAFVDALKDAVTAEEDWPLPELMFVSPDVAEDLGIDVDSLPRQTADGTFEFCSEDIGIGSEIQKDKFNEMVDKFVGELPGATFTGKIEVTDDGLIEMTVEAYEEAVAAGAKITLYQTLPCGKRVHVWINRGPVEEIEEYVNDSCDGCGAGSDDECTCASYRCEVCEKYGCTCDDGDAFFGGTGGPGTTGAPHPQGPTCGTDHQGPRGPALCKDDQAPDKRWGLVLQMLEERLRFEHQYTTANQLKEIREYLETP